MHVMTYTELPMYKEKSYSKIRIQELVGLSVRILGPMLNGEGLGYAATVRPRYFSLRK
jgi:hypothetical protein